MGAGPFLTTPGGPDSGLAKGCWLAGSQPLAGLDPPPHQGGGVRLKKGPDGGSGSSPTAGTTQTGTPEASATNPKVLGVRGARVKIWSRLSKTGALFEDRDSTRPPTYTPSSHEPVSPNRIPPVHPVERQRNAVPGRGVGHATPSSLGRIPHPGSPQM